MLQQKPPAGVSCTSIKETDVNFCTASVTRVSVAPRGEQAGDMNYRLCNTGDRNCPMPGLYNPIGRIDC